MYDKDQYSFHTLKNFILRKEKERVLKQLQNTYLGLFSRMSAVVDMTSMSDFLGRLLF